MTYSSETSEALAHTFVHTTIQGMGATGLRVNALPLDVPPTATPTATTSIGSLPAATPNTGYFGGGYQLHHQPILLQWIRPTLPMTPLLQFLVLT